LFSQGAGLFRTGTNVLTVTVVNSGAASNPMGFYATGTAITGRAVSSILPGSSVSSVSSISAPTALAARRLFNLFDAEGTGAIEIRHLRQALDTLELPSDSTTITNVRRTEKNRK